MQIVLPRFRVNSIYVSQALAGEPVGLAEYDRAWTVSYGPITLGTRARPPAMKSPTQGLWTLRTPLRLPSGSKDPATTDLN